MRTTAGEPLFLQTHNECTSLVVILRFNLQKTALSRLYITIGSVIRHPAFSKYRDRGDCEIAYERANKQETSLMGPRNLRYRAYRVPQPVLFA